MCVRVCVCVSECACACVCVCGRTCVARAESKRSVRFVWFLICLLKTSVSADHYCLSCSRHARHKFNPAISIMSHLADQQ